jgi:hypothetical protein
MRTLALALLCVIAFPASALAKGPIAATIEGPGLSAPLELDGRGSWDAGGPFPVLVQETAFFAAAWGGDVPMLPAKPAGELGARYALTYRLPGPAGNVDLIRQELYPHARGGPVTFTPPGQRFFDSRQTLGGWYRGRPRLRTVLLEAGLPPEAPPDARVVASDGRPPVAWIAGVIVVMALAALAVLPLRRRTRPAAA